MSGLLEFDAKLLSQAWLAAALASSDDDDRPIVYRTILIEQFESGIRLIANDGIMLIRAWVPFWFLDVDEPELDEKPDAIIIVRDPDKRAVDFFKFQFKSIDDDAPPKKLTLEFGVFESDGEGNSSFPGMESEWVSIEEPDVERIKLKTMDAQYPNWRSLESHDPSAISMFALSDKVLTRLGKLGKLINGVVGFEFNGDLRHATLNLRSDAIKGIVMPVSLTHTKVEKDD